MKANRFANNDEGVSAVIGVILMVAITVILAAVIAAFVFGMVGGVKRTYNVAATASRSGTTVVVTYNGGPDNDQLSTTVTPNLKITATDSAGATVPTIGATTLSGVGSTVTFNAISAATGKIHVSVTGTFKDGSEQVIMDSYV